MGSAGTTLRGISEVRGFLDQPNSRLPHLAHRLQPAGHRPLDGELLLRQLLRLVEGSHPRVFVPREQPHEDFGSIEDVCNYLLAHPEVLELVRERGPEGKAVFVFFDEETESLAADAGLEIALSAELRHRLDSKITTTRLADEAGVPSVPNVLGHAQSYEELMTLAREAGVGDDLVVQTPYGDSGKTTFFVSSKQDWDKDADDMRGQELKVMRRINPRTVGVEACLTRHGTVVGPLMTDLTGYPELTPYRGGWCGNDIFGEALQPKHREQARDMKRRLGDRLAQEGCRGLLEVDYLVDAESGELYLGELNPRVSGISSMTNVSAGAYADMPLFLFHLLEYMDTDYENDVDDVNERWAAQQASDAWSQLVLKQPEDEVDLLTAAPKTGVWRLDTEQGLRFSRWGNDWHSLHDDSEGFYLRVLAPGDYRYKGADLGILVARCRMQTDHNELTDDCRSWIEGIHSQFAGAPVEVDADPPPRDGSLAFKMG